MSGFGDELMGGVDCSRASRHSLSLPRKPHKSMKEGKRREGKRRGDCKGERREATRKWHLMLGERQK